MHEVLIGVGSNLETPARQVKIAINALKQLKASRFVQASQLYSSRPQGPQDQPDFVNAVVWIETTLAPLDLLDELQHLEQQQGKVKKRHWGERLIDLDILLYDDFKMDHPRLIIPHPYMFTRDFVLLPLQDLQPERIIQDKTVTEWANALGETFVKAN